MLASLVFLIAGQGQNELCPSGSRIAAQIGFCYSDIGFLYSRRGLPELVYPYSNDAKWRAPNSEYPQGKYTEANQGMLEYPAGMGYWIYAADELTHLGVGQPSLSSRYSMPQESFVYSRTIYDEQLVWDKYNELALSVVVWLAFLFFLWPLTRTRPRLFYAMAFSPLVFFELRLNWDGLALSCVLAALWGMHRGKAAFTGAALGMGAAVKLYPGFLFVPLLIQAWKERAWKRFAWQVVGGIITWLLVNAPAMLSGFREWKYFFTFNTARGADDGSLWLAFQHYTHGQIPIGVLNPITELLTLVAAVGIAWAVHKAKRKVAFSEIALLFLGAFLLINKVYSPQYCLWILPFVVLVWWERKPGVVVLWTVGELTLYFAKWPYLDATQNNASSSDFWTNTYFLGIGVHWVITLTMLLLTLRHLFMEPRLAREDESSSGEEAPADELLPLI